MTSDIRTTKDLFEHLVYFSHINQKTQYERPTFGNNHHHHSKENGIHNGNHSHAPPPSSRNVHHFGGASSSNVFNGNSNAWQQQQQQHPSSQPPTAVYNTRPQQQHQHQQQIQKQHLQQNGIVNNQSLNSQHQRIRTSPRGAMGYPFTTDISQLHGELLTARVQKGPKGLGFTLIGNDGTSTQPEFIQVIC